MHQLVISSNSLLIREVIAILLSKYEDNGRVSSYTHKRKFHLARHVSARHDTLDESSASRRACRATLFDKLDTAKMHGLDTSNVSCQDVTWPAKWNLGYIEENVAKTTPTWQLSRWCRFCNCKLGGMHWKPTAGFMTSHQQVDCCKATTAENFLNGTSLLQQNIISRLYMCTMLFWTRFREKQTDTSPGNLCIWLRHCWNDTALRATGATTLDTGGENVPASLWKMQHL